MAKKMFNNVEDKVRVSGFIVQGLSTLCIASIASLTGLSFAWPSHTVANFTSNTTALSYPMSSLEISVLGSLPNIGALIATPFCGYAVNTFGRKYSAMIFGLPFVVAWTIISVTTSVPLVIAANGLAGIGAAGQSVASVYIAEIAHDSIRGGLSSILVAEYFVGLLVSYAFGGNLTYNMVLYANLTISIIYIIVLMMLKESPVFLVQKGKVEEAAKSLAFYRQVDVTSKEVEKAIQNIKLQLDPTIDEKLQAETDPETTKDLLDKPALKEQQVSSWKFLKKSESSKRALSASLFLMISNTLMGAIVLQVYPEPLFEEAIPSMPSNLCSIFIALDFLVSVISCALIVDRFGRKFLMTSTSIASGIVTGLIGAQLVFHFAPHWFTAFLIYVYCYVHYLGAATVPFIIAAEVFLPEVRGLGNSIAMASLSLTNFIILVIVFPLVDNYGYGTLFFGFSCVCFIAAIYSHFWLPETKGLSADQIQLLFLKGRKRNGKL